MKLEFLTTPTTDKASFFGKGFHVDWILFLSTILIVATGILMIYSTEISLGHGYALKQGIATFIGLVGMIFLMVLPYQIFRTYTKSLYILMIFVLIGVLMFGVTLRATRGWFQFGPFFIQAPEVAKILFILSVAGYLDQRIEWYSPKSLVIPFLLAGFPILLILAEPDLSSSLVFFPATLVMFYVAGARALHLLSLCLVGFIATGIPLISTYFRLLGPSLKDHSILFFLSKALSGGLNSLWFFLGVCGFLIVCWWFLRKMRVYIPSLYLWVTLFLISLGSLGAIATEKVIKEYQRKRLVAFVNPELDPLGGGYNVRQSQIAIGSGQIFGKGYGNGTQSRLGFLPSRHTDFIFSVIGEELGFFRSLFILFLYFLIIWRSFEISLVSRDRFGSLVSAGFGAMFAFYALLNLGMTMGLAPVAGVPLPMLSYGGSSILSSLFSIGIVLSVHWRRYLL
ncbi:MAG: rod shape-determining protein RodA [Elusimicrobiota bacterium]